VTAETRLWADGLFEAGQQQIQSERIGGSGSVVRDRGEGKKVNLPPDRRLSLAGGFDEIPGGPFGGIDPDDYLDDLSDRLSTALVRRTEDQVGRAVMSSRLRGEDPEAILEGATDAIQRATRQAGSAASMSLINLGREAMVAYMDAEGDRVRHVERSGLAEGNQCVVCADRDEGGPWKYGSTEHQMNLCPDPDCAGTMDRCRCMLVYTWESEMRR